MMKHGCVGERKMSEFRRKARIGTVTLLLGVATACAPDPSTGDGGKISNDVTGSVMEWSVTVNAVGALAGEVTFSISNTGFIPHEFLVAKTTYNPGQIPIGENNRFDEDDPGIEVIDEITEWPPGETKVLTVSLAPGQYELLCNIEAHYGTGMWTSFTVS
jgi:uncharacterized cupredoxin-like copper-binding protein